MNNSLNDFDMANLLIEMEKTNNEKTKEYLSQNPKAIASLSELLTKKIRKKIKAAKTDDDFFEIMKELETQSPLAHSSVECLLFILNLPTFKPFKDWKSSLRHLPISQSHLEKLLDSGSYMPLSLRLVNKNIVNYLEDFKGSREHILIDLDYGILLFDTKGRLANLGLDRAMIDRYQKNNKSREFLSQDVLDVGMVRGYKFLDEKKQMSIRTIHVKTRAELLELIANLKTKIDKDDDHELWFRGQPKEYLLPNLEKEAAEGVCPYRNVTDISLLPSLYRNFQKSIENLKDYCFKNLELEEYQTFFKYALHIKQTTLRFDKNTLPEEKLPDAWRDLNLGLSSEMHMDGKHLRTLDFHPVFSALQSSFFFQHYGIDSNILDITKSIDVALFFAQNKIINGNEYAEVRWEDSNPVIYFMILNRKLDRFIDSGRLLEKFNLQRPIRQECGLLAGASLITRNYYSRFISIRVVLDQKIEVDPKITPSFIFPGQNEDPFLKSLCEFQNLRSLKKIKPFVLK